VQAQTTEGEIEMIVGILSAAVLLLVFEVVHTRGQCKMLEKRLAELDNDAPWNAIAGRHCAPDVTHIKAQWQAEVLREFAEVVRPSAWKYEHTGSMTLDQIKAELLAWAADVAHPGPVVPQPNQVHPNVGKAGEITRAPRQ
jgi:hypothetical protein